jgi:hypothetical protein
MTTLETPENKPMLPVLLDLTARRARLESLAIIGAAASLFTEPAEVELPANMWLTDLTAAQAGRVWFERFRPAYETGAVPEETQQLAMRFALQREFLEAAIERLGHEERPACSSFDAASARTAFVLLPSLGVANCCCNQAIPHYALYKPVHQLVAIARRHPHLALPPPHGWSDSALVWPTVIVSLSVAMLADWYLNRQATSIRIAFDDDGHTEEFLMWEQD